MLKSSLRASLLMAVALTQACAFFTATRTAAGSANTIKIGLVASFTGTNAGSGTTLGHAIDMALPLVNKAGLPGGKTIEILRGDTKSDPTTAGTVANSLIDQGVVALIGPNSSGDAKDVVTNAAKPHGVPMISPNASSPDFSDPSKIDTGGYFFRTCPSDALQGKVLAAKAQALGYKKLVVLHTDNAYGNGLSSVLEKSFGGTAMDMPYTYLSDAQQLATYDFTSLVKKMLDASPDAAVLVGYSGDASYIINGWIRDGRLPGLHWLFTDSTNRQDFVNNVQDKKRLEGQVGTTPYSNPTFLQRFRAAYPDDKGVQGATAYDALALIALAIAEAKDAHPASIRDHLRSVSGPDGEPIGPDDLATGIADAMAGKKVAYTGWAGPFNWDEHGDTATGKYVIWTVKDGNINVTSDILTP